MSNINPNNNKYTDKDNKNGDDVIHKILSGYNARSESQFEIINIKLTNIEEHLSKLNSRTDKSENDIITINKKLLVHSYECPIANRVKLLEDKGLIINATKEASYSTKQSIKKSVIFLGTQIVTWSSVAGIIFSFYKFIL